MTIWKQLFESKFRKVYQEVDKLINEIEDKEWFLFFSWHTRTFEELLESPHHYKIHSISRKIASDTEYLKKNNCISQVGLNEYYKHERQTERLLKLIENKIFNRDQTAWERVSSACRKFTRHIMNILDSPFVKAFLPSVVKYPIKLLNGYWRNQDKEQEQRLLTAKSSFTKFRRI